MLNVHQLVRRKKIKMGSNNIDALIAHGLALHRKNKIDQAEKIYEQVLCLDPENPDALHLKGVVLIAKNENKAAVEFITRAIILRPDEHAFYSNLAAALQKLGLAAKAQFYAEKALSLNMVNAESFVILGQSLVTQGNLDQALDKFNVALKIQPSNPAAFRGVVDVLSKRERYPELEKFLSARLQDGDRSDFILMKLATTHFNMKQAGEAIKLLDQCKHQAGHDWHVNKLKAHLALQQVESALPHGHELLVIKDKLANLLMEQDEIRAVHSRWPTNFRQFDGTSPHRNIVCFSLWGNDPKYTYTAVVNAKMVPKIYRGWTARFYVDDTVPLEIRDALVQYGAQVILVENDGRNYLKLFWRFLASDDQGVDFFISRDADAIVNIREKAAVDEWLASGKPFHMMRDHPEHAELIMAGMWGGISGLIPNLTRQAVEYYETHETKWRWVDQDFLRDRVWPIIKNHVVSHDTYYQFGSDARKFPLGSELPEGDHVGGYAPVTWKVKD